MGKNPSTGQIKINYNTPDSVCDDAYHACHAYDACHDTNVYAYDSRDRNGHHNRDSDHNGRDSHNGGSHTRVKDTDDIRSSEPPPQRLQQRPGKEIVFSLFFSFPNDLCTYKPQGPTKGS